MVFKTVQFAFGYSVPSARKQELVFYLKDVGRVRQYPPHLPEYRLLIDGLKGELVSLPHHLHSSLYQALQFRLK